jgi:hypothetical protein
VNRYLAYRARAERRRFWPVVATSSASAAAGVDACVFPMIPILSGIIAGQNNK